MAIYSIALRQSWDISGINRRKWSNVFFADAANPAAAAALGVGLWVNYLRTAVRQAVFCYEVYATSIAVGDELYAVQTVPEASQRGTLTNGSGEPYEPKSCVSVRILASQGRPSRKFWRPGLWEGDVVAGQTVNPTVTSAIESAFNDMLVNELLVDPDGQLLSSGVVTRYTTREFGRESTEGLPTVPAAVG